MSKTLATLALDAELLERAGELARRNQETVDQFVEGLLRREVAPANKRTEGAGPNHRFPTHGKGGLLPGVALEDKELMEHLVSEP